MSALHLASRIKDLESSPIRDILRFTEKPGVISFAGGLPAPECLPQVRALGMPPAMMQYGATEGETALRQQVAAQLTGLGLDCGPEQVIILSGSQQGIDLSAKLLVEKGATVALEEPGYLAAVQVFRLFGARLAAFDPSRPRFSDPATRLLYVIPSFQNPTGRCWSLAQRKAVAAACDRQGLVLFEDDPYRDIAFGPCQRQPVASLLRRAPWVYQGSFSKTYAPGLRLGFMAASPQLMRHLVQLKQASDLHSNRLSQWLVLKDLQDPKRPQRLKALCKVYGQKRDHFEAQLKRSWGGLARWSAPQGGLFFWLRLKKPVDTRLLLPLALEQGVAFMPGEPFWIDPRKGLGTLRLNFSHATAQQASQGLQRLAVMFKQALGA